MQVSIAYILGKTTGIAKEHSINKVSIVRIVGKFNIMRYGAKTVPVVCLCGQKGVAKVEWCV